MATTHATFVYEDIIGKITKSRELIDQSIQFKEDKVKTIYYNSKRGDDANKGDIDSPLKTLEWARERAGSGERICEIFDRVEYCHEDAPLDDFDFLHIIEKTIEETIDKEQCHILLDNLMEGLLISLGYKESVKKIRETERWYS